MPRRLLTEEEYLMIERAAEFKSEFLDGDMYAMAGAGFTHGQIISNLSGLLYNQFQGRPCKFVANDLRVRVADSGLYAYPDIVAVCGGARLLDHHHDVLLNPQLIIEVLSPSTAAYDRGVKADRYFKLESLTDYLVIEQTRTSVRQWSRQHGNTWSIMDYDQPSDRVRSEVVGIELALADIYNDIVFPPQVVPPPR